MSVRVHSHWVFMAESHADLFAYSDKLMETLLDQEACNDSFMDTAVSTDLGNNVIEVEADATGADLSAAIAALRAAIRAALHQVGIGTPDWPDHTAVMKMFLKDMHTEELV